MTLKKFNRKEYKKEYDKEYNLKNKEKIKEYAKEYYLKNKEKKAIYYLENREHKLKISKKFYLENRERVLHKQKILGDTPEYKQYRRDYNAKNLETSRNRERSRYQTDINFRLRKICRNRVRRAVSGFDKSASTMELIGCTGDELRQHLESKFEPWMNWENQGLGGWDIEHIKACANFDLADPEQQRACFNWSNLQPMEHIANMKKGTG